MTQFILKITLGNEAMITGYDIAGALSEVIEQLKTGEYSLSGFKGYGWNIKDVNGNAVGTWQMI